MRKWMLMWALIFEDHKTQNKNGREKAMNNECDKKLCQLHFDNQYIEFQCSHSSPAASISKPARSTEKKHNINFPSKMDYCGICFYFYFLPRSLSFIVVSTPTNGMTRKSSKHPGDVILLSAAWCRRVWEKWKQFSISPTTKQTCSASFHTQQIEVASSLGSPMRKKLPFNKLLLRIYFWIFLFETRSNFRFLMFRRHQLTTG